MIHLYKVYGYFLPELYILNTVDEMCRALESFSRPPPADSLVDNWDDLNDKVQKPDNDRLETVHLVQDYLGTFDYQEFY